MWLLCSDYHCLPSGGDGLLEPIGDLRFEARQVGGEGEQVNIFMGSIVLSTTSIRREDAGEYRCVVNNTAGQQTVVNITVNVQGEQATHQLVNV